jgi:hypothetical protein
LDQFGDQECEITSHEIKKNKRETLDTLPRLSCQKVDCLQETPLRLEKTKQGN